MACTQDFIDSVAYMLSELGEVRYRKMMGDYVFYLDDKCIITACDNLCFVKRIPQIEHLMQHAECASPYPGASVHYILDLDNKILFQQVAAILRDVLPMPKPRKKKSD